MRDELRMQDSEEAAARGDAIDAERDQLVGRPGEQVDHAVGIRFDDAVRRGAAHHGVLHGKPPARSVTDIAGQALKAGVEDHDPDSYAMDRDAAHPALVLHGYRAPNCGATCRMKSVRLCAAVS